jgi:enoyl-CoA hydratase
MVAKADGLVFHEVVGHVGRIIVRRKGRMNVLSRQVLCDLYEAATKFAQDPSVRVIVLTSESESSFIAGADVTELADATPARALAIASELKRLTDVLSGAAKPVVAVINGYCLGGGFEVALSCDIRIASSNATFGLPEIKLGIMPGGGGTVRLTKIAGSSVARMLAMTGEPIGAERAHALGILMAVHRPEELDAAAKDFVDRLSRLPAFALMQLKSSLNVAVDAGIQTACEAEMRAFALCFSSSEQKEGVQAFLEKRDPVFEP